MELISQVERKLIVIDNVDILLDDVTRKHISLDGKNQYLIIGRNPGNLFATRENLFELVSRKAGEQTVFSIKTYLRCPRVELGRITGCLNGNDGCFSM